MKALLVISMLALTGCRSASMCEINYSHKRLDDMEKKIKELSDLSADSFYDHEVRLKKLEDGCAR